MRRVRLFYVILTVLMLFSLVACGKESDEPKDPNLLKIGDYELLYKGAKILETSDGNDLLILTLDFTNNSKETISYLWAVIEWAEQAGSELEYADTGVYALPEVTESQNEEIAPGKTLEIQAAFVLADVTSKIEVTFEELEGDKNDKIKIDPSTLSRESAGSGTASLTGGSKGNGSGRGIGVSSGEQLRDWWNGDWYGWWVMTGCGGTYEDMEGDWWDICGTIDIGEDGIGTVTLWDEEYTKSEPMVWASVSLNEAGTGELGTMMSESGWFTDIDLKHADWIVDPGLVDYPDMIHIDGYYESGDDAYSYDIYLRPWGIYWDDVAGEDLPAYYNNWYLSLIKAGEPMPGRIG